MDRATRGRVTFRPSRSLTCLNSWLRRQSEVPLFLGQRCVSRFSDTRSEAVPWIWLTTASRLCSSRAARSVWWLRSPDVRSQGAHRQVAFYRAGRGAGLAVQTKNRYPFPIPRTTVAPQSTLTPCTPDTKKPLEPRTPCAWGGVGGHFVGDWR